VEVNVPLVGSNAGEGGNVAIGVVNNHTPFVDRPTTTVWQEGDALWWSNESALPLAFAS